MTEKIPSPLGLALSWLRLARGWSKQRLAAALRISLSLLARYERGDELSHENLEPALAPLDFPAEAVDVLLFAHRLIFHELKEEPASTLALTAEERRRIVRAALAAGWTAAEVTCDELIRRKRQEKLEAARREAQEAWERLKAATPEERRDLIATFPEFRTVALVTHVCEASVRAAAHRVDIARERAQLALQIAEQVPAEARLRAQGYSWGHIGNARRVATDFDSADEAFVQAWKLWSNSAETEPELLPEWRLLDLEASLRRAQHYFPEALALLERARAASDGTPMTVGRILLNKEHVFSQMGDAMGALAALKQAESFVESTGDPHLLFALRFNQADHLCRAKQWGQAAKLLPKVCEMAVERGNALELIRVGWLQAKVAAGQGLAEDAISRLEKVSEDFTAHGLPYEAGLSSLDLAVLWLKAGRNAEVAQLAVAMKWIFDAKGIDDAALEALSLFCAAARQEAATVELAQRVIAELEKAERSAPSSVRGRGRA
ncbi:MAG TPA: helix-turn-helix transcriptional regulator [Thermoanaerobaculia bacterium]|jgi:transcriptional regulator with XRE-family HTH domain|nr:helix-turn-helix transcriptional regulator [Thermoanaerobaculia bacterium]